MAVAVLYVTGWCRSGSTVLGNVLAEMPGVFHAGELRFLWRNGVLGTGSNRRCGCGADLLDCPLWSRVLVAGRPASRSLAGHAAAVVRWQAACRTRHTWRVRREPPRNGWPNTLAATYRAIAAQTGAQLIVDSSKYASDAALRLRYEDLTGDPRGSVARVLALVGRGAEDNPVTEDGHAELGPNHTVTGNPNRFERGCVSLREDRRWHDSLPAPRRAAATALAWPLIGRHDYSRKP